MITEGFRGSSVSTSSPRRCRSPSFRPEHGSHLWFRTPERFARRNELDRNLGHEGLQPPRTLFHPCLFRRDVAEDDQRLLFALANRVRDIFDRFPFLGFADYKNLHSSYFQCLGVTGKSSSAG